MVETQRQLHMHPKRHSEKQIQTNEMDKNIESWRILKNIQNHANMYRQYLESKKYIFQLLSHFVYFA